MLNPYYVLRWRRKELGLDAEGDAFNDYETASSAQDTPDDGGVDTDNHSGNDALGGAVAPADSGAPDANSGTGYASINQATSTGDEASGDQFPSTAPENTSTQDAPLLQEPTGDNSVPNDGINDDTDTEGGGLDARNQQEDIVIRTANSEEKGGESSAVMNAKDETWSSVRVGVRWKA